MWFRSACVAGIGIACVVVCSAPAAAQEARHPLVEFGADYAFSPQQDGWRGGGPRLTLNVDSRTSVELALAVESDRGRLSHVHYVLAHARRALYGFERGALSGSIGAALSTRTFDPFPDPGPFPLRLEPDRSWGPSFGLGVDVRVAPLLGVRAETQYLLTQEPVLRFALGGTVPVGRYPDAARETDAAPVLTGPFARVRVGQTVWVETAGGVVREGIVASRTSQALTLRDSAGATAIAASEVRTIDTTDSLVNGVVTGSLTGAAGGAGLGIVGGRAWCEGTSSCVAMSALLLGGLGSGIGALTGAMIDSFRDGRRRVFEAGSSAREMVVTPVWAGRSLGAAATIRW